MLKQCVKNEAYTASIGFNRISKNHLLISKKGLIIKCT